MNLEDDKTYKMKMRDVEAAFKYRRIPYPKRSVEIIAIIAISCTFLLFLHTNKLNTRLKDMEIKLQPSELSGLGLIETGRGSDKAHDPNSLQGTYKRLKETGQLDRLDANLLNNTRKADVEVLFFNRCAKVGSEAMLELLLKLENYNGLNVEKAGLKRKTVRQKSPREQLDLAEEIAGMEDGSVYIEHVNWIDFEAFDIPKPIYINLVRDPVERVISWFFYARGAYKNAIEYNKDKSKKPRPASWYKKDFNECVRSGDPECQYVPFSVKDKVANYKRQSLFFCGHHDDCYPFNSPAAVQMAKEHVERDYAVVGSWEDTNITLTVLEKYIPRFFKDAKMLFELHNDVITNRNKNHRKPKIYDDVRAMIRKNLTNEFDFYYFCKQRLYKQYLAISLNDLKKHGLV